MRLTSINSYQHQLLISLFLIGALPVFTDSSFGAVETLHRNWIQPRYFTAFSTADADRQFKAIRKINIRKDIRQAAPAAAANQKVSPAIQFNVFPEGGQLIYGLPARLAFKAVDRSGNPTDISGTLFENDLPVTDFASRHAGMGSLEFTPMAGKRYHIRLKQQDTTYQLPQIAAKGISLRLLRKDSAYLYFILLRNPGSKPGMVYFRGQLRGLTYCTGSAILDQELKLKIPLAEFNLQGIAEFTAYDEDLLPVAERLVYVHPEKQ